MSKVIEMTVEETVVTSASVTQSYDSSKLGKLEGLEAVRKKPGMYIGGTDERALHHCVSEVLDNSVDEHLAGHCDRIEVTVHVDGSISIRDNGRGIPVDQMKKFKKSALEVIFTTLHAGGKFEHGNYKTAGGLHGVGVSVVKALSSSMRVEVLRDGKRWVQEYRRGAPTMKVTARGGAAEANRGLDPAWRRRAGPVVEDRLGDAPRGLHQVGAQEQRLVADHAVVHQDLVAGSARRV